MDALDFEMPTQAEIDRITRDAHAMRAQFIATWVGKVIGWIARPRFRHHPT